MRPGNNQVARMQRSISLILTFFLAMTLVACGGGGGSRTPANVSPTANAGTDQTVSEGAAVTLSGSGTDSDGSIASYAWTQTAGPTVTLSATNAASVSFTAPATITQVVLTFRLTVTDNQGANASDTINITVNTTNIAPTADAGPDQTVNEGDGVLLAGSGTDTDGSIASYAWVQSSGPTVSLSNSAIANPGFTAPDLSAPAILVFQLTVTDNRGAASPTDSVQITVNPVVGRNNAPTANAGADQATSGGRTVSLAGSGTDGDGSIASYLWVQTSGTPVVTLSNANTATASFTAPDNVTTVLTFQLTVTDNEGATASDSVNVSITPAPTVVTVSGKVTFDRAVHNANNSLNLTTPVVQDVRGAVIELLPANGPIPLATTSTDSQGNYSFSDVPVNTDVRVRVKAQMLKTGTPSWNFEVVDNTNGKVLYSMTSANFNTGTTDQTRNLHAALGTGSTYTTVRVAGPFAILDSVYQAYNKVLSAAPNFQFQPVKLNWSVNNTNTRGDLTIGEIGTSFFNGTEIYILGKADVDTDEFDGHVVIHEWGHYFEGFHSRSDSIGGPHGGNDKLDMRVAFGEGFGNALSGMVTDNPIYRDSLGVNSSQGFSINVESNDSSSPGWAGEGVVQGILYDLYDSGTESGDGIALGFTPIFDVLVNHQRTTDAFTSIFTFVTGLKAQVSPSDVPAIDALVNARAINSTSINDFATNETNFDVGNNHGSKVYFDITPGQTINNICSYATHGDYNKLGNRRFLRMTLASDGNRTISVPSLGTTSDPDFYIYRAGTLVSGNDGASSGPNVTEIWSGNLTAGTYVIDLHEYFNVDNPTNNERESCFSVTLN